MSKGAQFLTIYDSGRFPAFANNAPRSLLTLATTAASRSEDGTSGN